MAAVTGPAVLRSTSSAAAAAQEERTLHIEGTGSRADYSLAVSDSLEAVQVNNHETVGDDTAAGLVGGGTDIYRFTGDLQAFNLDGRVNVDIDGEPAHVGQLPDYRFTINGIGNVARYEFDVTRNLEPVLVNGHDDVTDTHASGMVGGGTDIYTFDSDLEAFTLEGKIDAHLNGQPAHVGELPASDPIDDGDSDLDIRGSGSRTDYTFTVTGGVESVQINNHDTVRERSATGHVGGGTDSYALSGDLRTFDFNGDAGVTLDGQTLDPADYRDHYLVIQGSGTRADYTVETGGPLDPMQVNNHDNVREQSATGHVGGGTDGYAFDGDLRTVTLDGNATVLLDGVTIDPDDGGDGGDLRLGYNARERSHVKGTTFENFGDFSAGWEPRSGRVEQNTTDFSDPADDAGCATLVSDGDNNRVEMVNRLNSENFAYRDPSMAVRLRGTSNETLRVDLAAGDGSEEHITSRYLSEKHGWVRVPIAPSRLSGTPDMADINEFTISCYTGGKSCEIDVDDIRTTDKRGNGAVLFTFDDANATDYTVAYEELSARGWAGTSAVIPRVVGNGGKLSQSQIDRMDDDGWAFAAHPQAQSRSGGLGSIPGNEAEQMMRDNKQWLLDNTSGRGANTLVWPFGDFDEEALDIAGDYFDLAWGGGSSTTNGVVTEAGWLARVELNEDGDVDGAIDAIEDAYRTETVVTFMTHGMGGSNVSRARFNDVLDRIEFRGLDVLTTVDFADEQ